MHIGKKTLKREKSAMTLSLYGSLVFAIVEIGMAVFSGSQAVLLDAVYDSVEFFMMLPSIFLIPLLYRPSSEQHPFGYTQIETGFVVVKGAIMAAVTFGLIFNNIHLLLHGGHKVSFHTISAFELFACLLSLTMAICLYFKNKHMSSPLVNVELQTWKIDCVVSLGMAVAFLLPIIVPFAWFQRLTPYLDQIITIILSAFMLPTPIKTVITGLRDLMLWPPEAETVDDIKATVEPIIGGYGHKNLYYDIVRTGRRLWISVYITFDKDIISLSKFQILQTKCIAALAEKYQDFYFELQNNFYRMIYTAFQFPDIQCSILQCLTDARMIPHISRHYHIVSGFHTACCRTLTGGGICRCRPVCHDRTCKSPFIPCRFRTDIVIVCRMHTVNQIIGRHHRHRLGTADRCFKSFQIDFAQCPLR